MITVLLRYEHHVDHTFLEATHYRDDDGVRTVHRSEEEVARFPVGSGLTTARTRRCRI